jgi:3-deoxy-D-manno-octulosonic acid kinase
VYDHYVWLGVERTRAFREWRLLHDLHRRGLPVPEPLAARVVRTGPIYQADIAIAYLPGTRTLTSHLDDEGIGGERWLEIGRMLRRFHDLGVDHPDLTAHNILIDAERRLFLVDFDNATVRPPGPWKVGGLKRLQRSLRKVALETGTQFDTEAWVALSRGYEGA